MTSRELRQSFLDFFRERGHTIVPSAPVVPHGDPTLLFTNAGMNQFKDVFLGTGTRDYSRAADTQKCVRVSGKHNDLEEVGHDTYHHTFFEMLGNWSFGDYYKREAITWAWELVTNVWGLPKERIHVTVYRADDGSEQDQEAYDIWRNETDIIPDHIHWFGAKDNFWEMGDTGPCGPCSEIHFDRTPDGSGGPLVNAGSQDVIEFWNLVFIQYNRKADKSLEELPAKHVDTGMGFERICALVQGKASNYDTDVFMPLLQEISRISGKPYSGELDDRPSIAMRVLADHVRTVAFAIADGATPGNAGRGYVLRRLLRRAVKYAFIDLDVKAPILYRLVPVLAATMGDVFPEIVRQREYIEKIIRAEEEQFGTTIEKGIWLLDNRTEDLIKSAVNNINGDNAQITFDSNTVSIYGLRHDSKTRNLFLGRESESTSNGYVIEVSWNDFAKAVGHLTLSAADAFFLYDTCGFPLDLTELLARERGMTVDVAGFNVLMDEQKRRAREARKHISQEAVNLNVEGITEFVGYDQTIAEANVLAVTEHGVVVDRTPLYAEMGGQVSDHGTITIGGEAYQVTEVHKVGNFFLHTLETEPAGIAVGDSAVVQLATDYRAHIQRNHSATHILHETLRRVLGSHVQQAGSLVAPHHLRFDFNHFSKVGEEELREIEAMVNAKIREGIAVQTEEITIEVARTIPNVKMFFGDKYGSRVRVVTIDPAFSVEFCGGTHVRNTAEIGFFKLTSESSIQAGVRRIEAITGADADTLLLGRYQEIERLSKRLGVSDRELYQKVEALLEEKKGLEKELAEVRLASAAVVLDGIINAATTIQNVRVASGQVVVTDIEALKSLGDDLRNRLGSSGVGLLGAEIEGKAQFVCVVTDDLTVKLSAGKIVGAVAKLVGGGGGGKAHLATAGGRQVENLESALQEVQAIVRSMA